MSVNLFLLLSERGSGVITKAVKLSKSLDYHVNCQYTIHND